MYDLESEKSYSRHGNIYCQEQSSSQMKEIKHYICYVRKTFQNMLSALPHNGGGEIAQWLASLSVKPAVQVRALHDCFRKVEFYQCAILSGFCLSLYGLHVLNRDVNMVQTNYPITRHYIVG